MSLTSLTFEEVAKAQIARDKRWQHGHRPWLLPDWGNALAGEVGELCNAVKKHQRILDGSPNVSDRTLSTTEETIAAIGTECGDAFCYLQLLAIHAGVDLEKAIINVFNKVSVRNGFPERLYSDGFYASLGD